MRLFHWLKQVGKMEIDTSSQGSRVDFLLYPHDDPKAGPIELEAFVVHPSEEEEAFWRFFRGLEQLIRETDPQVCCTLELDWVREGGLEKEPPVYRRAQLRRVLHNFLAHPRVDDVLVFRAAWEKRWVVRVTVVELRRREDCAGSPVRFGGPGRPAWATPLPVYRAMKRKMEQHKARKGRRPLVLAVGLYRWEMDPEEVVQALCGNHLLSFREDLDFSFPLPLDLYLVSTQVPIFSQAKLSGLLFHSRTHVPVHRSLSGVLVFPIGDVPVLPASGRAGMYIENPMARFPVDPNLWPVCQRFVEVRSTEGLLLMEKRDELEQLGMENLS